MTFNMTVLLIDTCEINEILLKKGSSF